VLSCIGRASLFRPTLCLLAVIALSASGCSGQEQAPAQTYEPPVGAALEGDFTSSGIGSLRSANALPDVDPRLAEVSSLTARFTYISRSGIDDSEKETSAAVFAPKGDPPPNGWPMVAFGHPAAGVLPDCGPSTSPTLFGSAGMVAQLVAGGYVVVVPDYQGLGQEENVHPFLDSTTEGYNLIDSMSAVRKLVLDSSPQWFAVGLGQGGQAAWAADELAVDHSLGLDLRGAVSLSPLADIEGLADVAVNGNGTPEQRLTLVRYIQTLRDTYGDAIDIDAFRRGSAVEHWDELLSCNQDPDKQGSALGALVDNDDLKPNGVDAADTLRGFLQKTTLPQGPTYAPMLVIYGGRDPVVPQEWTRGALNRACAMGDVIQIAFQPDAGGATVDTSTMATWMADRLNGVPPVNDCPGTP
jgi:pimeloyl-ACP methyl ester carboxylesterase